MSDNRPIALFDSGVGGLSILSEIKKALPDESVIYFADQKNNPYSNKRPREIKEFSKKIAKFLEKQNAKLIVAACNTVSCYAIDDLRAQFKMPIVGTVPAVKPAAQKTKNGKIAVLATSSTAKSKYLKDLIKNHAPNAKVLVMSSQKLVEEIEKGDIGGANKTLTKYLAKVDRFAADTLVLGCTHFPFLKNLIGQKPSLKVMVIDSGEAIAKQVKNILESKRLMSDKKHEDRYFTSGNNIQFSKVASYLLKYKVEAQKVNL